MTLRILVTGGAGYLGSVLCERLLDAGHYVTVLDSLIYQQNSLFHLCANQRFEFIHGTRKLLYLASSCIYPKFVEQPMSVKSLMSGGLEPTNEPYAVAKLAGLYLCRAYRQQFQVKFIAAIPANVFGPADEKNELRPGARKQPVNAVKISQC